ncbi:hypothetical protein F4009_15015 [Candidatus Poribacteria bacterium]|nr:hypothetical protein [Candidatus Poribacteria bacterium]MYA69829.1 hypothetical protein [Candidatus Poribacteria bacterium]MYH83077.1 hypothetical protein [Candidatus Poribacteria bacterium]MYK95281.1 hypothetical protein [Candidatus Poribacteria bacterium]
MFIRKYWLPISVFLLLIVGIGLYSLQTRPPKDPIVIYKPVEPIEKPTEQPKAEAPVGDTSQGGHVHADGTWHAEPHAPVEVSEAEVSADVQAAPIVAAPENTQIAVQGQELSAPSRASRDAFEAWIKWTEKHKELRNEYSQANQALIDVLPSTEEEQKRHDTDEQFKREVGRKVTEAGKKIGDVLRRIREHEAKRVHPPNR